jgi:hypothetical protein
MSTSTLLDLLCSDSWLAVVSAIIDLQHFELPEVFPLGFGWICKVFGGLDYLFMLNRFVGFQLSIGSIG